MLSSCCQMSVLSLVIVTLGIVHDAEGVADGVGVDDLEGDGLVEDPFVLLASAEALTGSTVSWPLWAGPQALSAIPVVRHSAATRRRRRSEG